MRTIKKNTLLIVLSLLATVCFSLIFFYAANTTKTVKADEEPAIQKTNFSVSKTRNYILLATPITGSVAEIYEVGYEFYGEDGTPVDLVQNNNKSYYTSINGKGAKTLFGGSYTDETPMIVWEISYNEKVTEAVSYKAYFKKGVIVDDVLYTQDPEVIVYGAERNLKTYQVTWIDANKDTADKTTEVAYNEQPTFPWAYFEKRGDGEHIYSMTLKRSDDGGETWANASSGTDTSYNGRSSTIMPWGNNLSEIKTGMASVTSAGVKYQITYNNECPIETINSGSGVNASLTVAQDGVNSAVCNFSNIAKDGSTINKFRVHGDINIYQFEAGNKYLALQVSAVGDASASLDVNGITGTGSVIIPAEYMSTWDESANHYVVEVKISSGSATGFTATFGYADGTASEIATVDNNYTTNFGSFHGVNLENYLSTTSNITAYETAYNSTDLTSKSILAMDGHSLAKVAVIKSSYTVVDDTTGSDLKTRRFTVTGNRLNNFHNGETFSALAPSVTHNPYGKCARIVLSGGTDAILKVTYNLSPDLSDYDYVLVGIYSEIGTANWKWKGADGTTNVANATTVVGECKTLKVSVNDFLNGYLFTDGGASGDRYWLTPIIAIDDIAGVNDNIDAYLTAVGSDGVTLDENSSFATWSAMINNIDTELAKLSDEEKQFVTNLSDYNAKKFKLIEDMKGSGIKDRVIVSGAGVSNFHNGSTFPALAAQCNKDPYGYCSRIVSWNGLIKIQYQTDALDLSGYKYVLLGFINLSESSDCRLYINDITQVATVAANGGFTTLKLTVEDFMALDPETGSKFISYNNTTPIWLTSIIAVGE